MLFWGFCGMVYAMQGNAEQKAEVSKGAKPCQFENLPRPSVMISRERLEELKKEITTVPWKKRVYEKVVKTNADLWLERSIVIPERSGHYHRFFCTDGVKLETPEDQMFKTNEYRCPACGKVYKGEPYDGGRRWHEHRWLYYACNDLALVYALEGEKKYAEKAAEILRKYADAYPGRHTTHVEGGIIYQSLGEAVMMIPMAQAYDLIYNSGVLTPDDKKHIEYDLFWESAQGILKRGIGGNWGSWHLCAVGVIGLATRHQRFIDFGIKSFKSQIKNQLGSDGIWPESIHCYHFYPLRAFIQFAEACSNTGIDLYNWKAENGKCLKSMFTAPVNYMYPNAQLPAINDGWFLSWLPSGQYEAAYYRYRIPKLAYALLKSYQGDVRGELIDYANYHKEPWSLVLGAALPPEIPPASLKSVNFDNIGICVLRTGEKSTDGNEIMLTFDYGRFLGHGQFDIMGVTLYGNGRILAADYGTPGYGSSILPYYKGGTSHNTVLVDGKNHKKTKQGKLILFHDSPVFKLSKSETGEAYPGISWSRTVALTDSYSMIVDELSSDKIHQYDWFFHNEGDEFKIDGCEEQSAPASNFSYDYIKAAKGYKVKGGAARAVWNFRDGSSLHSVLFHDAETEIFTAQCPAETGARTVPLIVMRERSKSCRFLAFFFPIQAGGTEKPQITKKNPNEIVIEYKDKIDEIHIGETIRFLRKNEKGEIEVKELY